jgi:hypothetical protein
MKLSEAHKPKDAIEAAKAYKGDSCNNYPHIYGNAYGELRRQTIWQRIIRGIFKR